MADPGAQGRAEKQEKLTAFRRVDLLFDPGTFVELDQLILLDCHDFDIGKNVLLGDEFTIDVVPWFLVALCIACAYRA